MQSCQHGAELKAKGFPNKVFFFLSLSYFLVSKLCHAFAYSMLHFIY